MAPSIIGRLNPFLLAIVSRISQFAPTHVAAEDRLVHNVAIPSARKKKFMKISRVLGALLRNEKNK
jgi:hypothetical protein